MYIFTYEYINIRIYIYQYSTSLQCDLMLILCISTISALLQISSMIIVCVFSCCVFPFSRCFRILDFFSRPGFVTLRGSAWVPKSSTKHGSRHCCVAVNEDQWANWAGSRVTENWDSVKRRSGEHLQDWNYSQCSMYEMKVYAHIVIHSWKGQEKNMSCMTEIHRWWTKSGQPVGRSTVWFIMIYPKLVWRRSMNFQYTPGGTGVCPSICWKLSCWVNKP